MAARKKAVRKKKAGERTIVIGRCRPYTRKVADALKKLGIKARVIQGNMIQVSEK